MGEVRDASYRKSSYSGANNNCVEIARVDEFAGIRDSKVSAGERRANTLVIPAASLAALLQHAARM